MDISGLSRKSAMNDDVDANENGCNVIYRVIFKLPTLSAFQYRNLKKARSQTELLFHEILIKPLVDSSTLYHFSMEQGAT